ncbi:hypothetical protein F1559_001805 [Cyanidiococcus yangmingshanensis]|uniref:Stress response protein NST1 n=1 Tax=Cyanidiococcus yangmingshanensis TaxID=2690220 RepID=A0A7J7IGD9_9RHOD|nr:hypothetical protein F1559_001805 [Cyanidiococcus yangmingshanensis]
MSQFSTSQVARLAAASTSESVQLSTPALTRGIELMDGIEENPLDVYTAENNALGLRVGVVSQNFELLSKLRSRTLLTSDQEYMAESLQWFEKFRKLLSVGGYARLGPCAKTIVDARDIPLLAGGCIALCDVLLYRSSSCKAGQTSLAEALRSSELEEELQLLRRSSARCEVSHQLWDSFLEALQQRRLLPEAELHYLLRRIRIGQEIHQHDTHGNRDSVLGDMNSLGVVLDHHLHSLYRVRPQLFEEACSTDPIISTPKGAGKSSRVEISVVSAFDGGVDSSIETATERKQLTDWDCCLPRGESEGLSRDRVCGRVLTSVVAAGNGVDLGSDDGRSRFEKEREAERVERSPPSADSNGFHRFIASLDASTLARLCAIRKEDVVALARDLQPGDCFCSVCRRRRAFIWESLGNLFDLYYQILESDQRMTEKSTAEELTSKSNGCQVFDEAPLVPISGIDEEDEDIERPSVVNGEACLRQILEARSGALVLSIDRMNQQGMDLNTLVERLSESRWRLRYGTLGTGPSGAFENVVDRNAAGTEWQSGDIRLISKPDAGRVSGFNLEHDSMRQELNRLVLPFREDFVAYRGVWEEVLECYIYSRVLEFVMRMRREGKLDINGNVVCEADEYSRANLAQAEKRETTATNSASCIPGTEHIPGGRKLLEVYLARLLERRLVGAYREMKAFECQKALLEEEAAEGFRSHKQRKKSKKRCGKDRKVAAQPLYRLVRVPMGLSVERNRKSITPRRAKRMLMQQMA